MKRFRRIRVPTGGHPLIRMLFIEMNARKIGVVEMAERAGVSLSAIQAWQGMVTHPKLYNIEACLNAVGIELIPTRKGGDAT